MDESAFADYLDRARRLAAELAAASPPTAGDPATRLSPEFERLRWFVLPSEG